MVLEFLGSGQQPDPWLASIRLEEPLCVCVSYVFPVLIHGTSAIRRLLSVLHLASALQDLLTPAPAGSCLAAEAGNCDEPEKTTCTKGGHPNFVDVFCRLGCLAE